MRLAETLSPSLPGKNGRVAEGGGLLIQPARFVQTKRSSILFDLAMSVASEYPNCSVACSKFAAVSRRRTHARVTKADLHTNRQIVPDLGIVRLAEQQTYVIIVGCHCTTKERINAD